MAHLYKPTIIRYIDAQGNRCPKDTPGAKKKKIKSRVWRGKYRDADGVLQDVSLCKNKEAARQLLADKDRHAERQAAGMVDPFADHRKKPLKEHIADFRNHLESKGDCADHVKLTESRVRSVIEGCRFQRIPDVSASRISDWLKEQRDGGMGISTSNGYLIAVKSFMNWLVKDRRTNVSPLVHLSRLNADVDVRRKRRHLSDDDFGRLLKAAREGGAVCGLSGQDRETLYLTAGYTGLRASELASLTAASFDFGSDPPTVKVAAGYSKHRREDVLPVQSDLAERLREWLQNRSDGEGESPAVLSIQKAANTKPDALWPGTWAENRHGAEMLREDLQKARSTWIDEAKTPKEKSQRERSDTLQYLDDSGRVFDFHALRHQFISMLARAGVHPKTAQELARHSTITLTMDHYTHVGLHDLSGALAKLPTLGKTATAETGT